MQERWDILLYTTPQGSSPVKEFIDGLGVKAQAKIRNTIALLREFGIALGPPHAKKVTGTFGYSTLRRREKLFSCSMGSKNIRIKYPQGKLK